MGNTAAPSLVLHRLCVWVPGTASLRSWAANDGAEFQMAHDPTQPPKALGRAARLKDFVRHFFDLLQQEDQFAGRVGQR